MIQTDQEKNKNDIAIIGMGCIFPKSRHLKEYWHLLFNGIDAISDIPAKTHWKLKDYFHSDPATPDHTYCKRGGFLPSVSFDPLSYGIPPNNLGATDTSQLLGLEVAKMALDDAGYSAGHPFLADHKVNVILGITGTQELVIPLGARLGHPIWKKALEDSGIREEKRQEILERIQGDYVQWQENSFPGLLGNVVAGRIANRLDLSGTNTVSDAACASSLSALHTAVMELCSGKCDMSITGGADTLNDIFMHMCFSKTGVLSHTSDARPFSKDADGTVLGEGIGMMVLKRLGDAEKANDRIYAVLKGIGTSSDGRTSAIYAPDSNGQLKALKEAYRDSGVDPSTVGLVEAHGTGTRVGDKVEFEALKKCFDPCVQKNKTAIGTVKSMIGHTKAAAGAAGMIKTVLSLYNKVIPPTLKATKPDPELDINNSSFYLNSDSRPWVGALADHPRRSGVSAFGFGGSNFHAVLEEYTPFKKHVSWDGAVQIFAFSSKEMDLLTQQVRTIETILKKAVDTEQMHQLIAWKAFESRKKFDSKLTFRLTVVHHKGDDILQTLDAALNCVETKKSASNIYFASGKRKGKLGFLFPGQGSQYVGMGKDLISTFPEALDALESSCHAYSKHKGHTEDSNSIHDYIFAPPVHIQSKRVSEEQLRRTDIAQPAIGAISLGMIKILKRFGISPQIACGHSFGELSALYSAGWINENDFTSLAVSRGSHMAAAGKKEGDAGSMLAIQADLLQIEKLIEKENLDVVLANKNSRSQGVISGDTNEILRAKSLCKQHEMRAVQLPVAAAFHSRLVKDATKPFTKDVDGISFSPTIIEVLSNTTGTPYSKKKSDIKHLLGNQLANPVNFVNNIEQMVDNNVSAFVEVGPKSVLTGLVKSMVNGPHITAIALDGSLKKTGVENLAHVLCQVAANGFDIDLTQWEDAAQKPVVPKMRIQLTGANAKPTNRCTLPKSKEEPMLVSTPVPAIISDTNIKPGTNIKSNTKTKPITKTKTGNRSEKKGSGMMKNREQSQMIAKTQPINGGASIEAMKMVQKGLEAMQQLQTQTAQAHEKFLETQALASKTLGAMMEQTRNLSLVPPFQSGQSGQTGQTGQTGQFHPVMAETISPSPSPVIETTPDIAAPEIAEEKTVSKPVNLTHSEKSIVDELPPQPEPEPESGSGQNQQILFEIVSQLTGFPVEMLEPEMDIESDLGIDSIKKVEIISELEKKIPACEGLTTDTISSVRTLHDICQSIQSQTGQIQPGPIQSGQAQTNRAETVISTTSAPNSILKKTFEPSQQTQESVPVSENMETTQAVATVLIETISELTGFPVEMLEPSMNLESDLGIDSIKRVEILSKLEQALDHIDSISSDDIASLKTIEEIINYLTDSDSTSPQGVKKKLQTTGIENGIEKKDENPAQPVKELTRQIVSLEEYPTNQIRFYNGARIDLPAQKKVYITQDSSGLGEQFVAGFQTIGIAAQLIDISNGNIPDLPDAAGLVIVPDAFVEDDKQSALAFLKSAFELIKVNGQYLMEAGDQKGAFLTAISFMGGTFGFSDSSFNTDPVFGGLSGLIKTAAIEFKDVLCRSLDMPDDMQKCRENTEAAVALMMTHGAVEMGLDGDSCNIPILDNKSITSSPVSIESDDVMVITGGAKGVTAACAIELAKQYSPVIVLIGRSDLLSGEAHWSKNIDEPSRLKKAILTHAFGKKKAKPADIEKIYKQIISNRQIRENITLMEEYGSSVQYFSADIRNKDQISEILNTVRESFGKISGIIHGAGVLEDKLIVDKRMEQFSRVLETKVLGLEAILSATKNDSLKYMVLFSSIAARTGNQGQSDYAMANEILNKTAKLYSMENPECKVVSVNWGPWEGGMVDDSLKKEFLKRGIDLIPLEAGARQLLTEMGNENIGNPEIVIGAHLLEPKKPKAVKLSKVMTVSVSQTEVPVLASHKIAGEPVVPFALLMEYHAHAAEKNNPGLVLSGMDNIRLLKGIRPGNNLIDVDVNIGKCKPGSNGFEAASTLTSTSEGDVSFIHSSGTIILKEKRSKPPVLSSAAFMELKPYKRTIENAYADILFHGKALQGITRVHGCSKKGIEVLTTLAPEPEKWFKNPPFSRWAIEPMMLDAAFQAAILWTYETKGQVCLPSFIANLRLYSSFDTLKGNVRILFTVNEETKNKVKGYFTFLDENNTVVASITGFEAITDPSLNEKFKNRPLFSRNTILSFAQGNPSEAFGEKYKIFDTKRQIARLPRPPYFFMDRVMSADHPQWEMVPGGFIEAQYEVPVDEWYFRANRTRTMPFCILLEIALQPCGWLAAYAGSALQSDDRLYFRNLGGKGTLLCPIHQNTGILTMRCRMKEVSKAGGMIIQDFEMEVLDQEQVVYKGTTNFGFFTQQALSNQVGIRNSKFVTYSLTEHQTGEIHSYTLPHTAPLTPDDPQVGEKNGMPSKALQMIDQIDVLSLDEGLYKNGYIKATKTVDPKEWFFDAHFYQDPVCPGSLGVESFLQLVRFFLLTKYNIDTNIYEASMLPGSTHEWSYRGQIIPKNKTIEVHTHIKEVNHQNDTYTATADGALIVDGICIYEMQAFTLEFDKLDATTTVIDSKKIPEQKM